MSNMKVTPLHCQTLLKKNVKKYITETVDGTVIIEFRSIPFIKYTTAYR